MSENSPKTAAPDSELASGDVSEEEKRRAQGYPDDDPLDLGPERPAAADLWVQPEITPELVEKAHAIAQEYGLEEAESHPTKREGLAKHHPEQLEPFWIPLPYRKAQKRDTLIFGLAALVAIVAGSAALAFFNPFGGVASGPQWLGPTAAVIALVAIVAVLGFGLLALLDLAKAERAYYASTHQWLQHRYGLDLSKHKVKALSRHRSAAGSTTSWKTVHLEGYPSGVQIIHTEQDGYRLITTVDHAESQLPRTSEQTE